MRNKSKQRALKLCGFKVTKSIDYPNTNDFGCIITSYNTCGVVKVMNIELF